MNIQNCPYNKNFSVYNLSSVKPLNFRGIGNFPKNADIVVSRFYPEKNDLKILSEISKYYDKVAEKFSKFNGPMSVKYKSLYPGVAEKTPLKGFLFLDLLPGKRNANIVKYSYSGNVDIAFNIFDKKNELLEKFLIKKNGEVECRRPNHAEDIFINSNNFSNMLDLICNEMSDFSLFVGYLKEVSKNIKKGTSKTELMNFIKNQIDIKNSQGIKTHITDTYSASESLSKILYKKQGNGMFELKKKFFDDFSDDDINTKGFLFKNVNEFGGDTISYCPLKSAKDSRKFKLFVYDKNMNLKEAFITFDDGKVAELKSFEKARDLRSGNYTFLTDEEIRQKNLKNYCEFLKNEFKRFEEFVKQYRFSEKEKNIQAKKIERETILKQKSAKKTEQKTDILKNTIKKTEINPNTKNQKLEEIPNILHSASRFKKQSFVEINLTYLTEALDKLFAMAVNERSPHLVHEKMKNGQIFSGRVHMIAKDGTKITLSKVKSPKYVEFTYYSIQMEKNGKTAYVNIDPLNARIIETAQNGRPIIHNGVKIKHIAKEDIQNLYPQIENLPEYLTEVFEIRKDGKMKIINTNLKQKIVVKNSDSEFLENNDF